MNSPVKPPPVVVKYPKTINWTGSLFLLLTPPVAVVLTISHIKTDGFMWSIWAMAAVFYYLTAGSITGGYHRYFAHRTYQAKTWLKWYWAIFGGAAFQNSILTWARDHRLHHRFVDTDLDPYSINRGFFFAHFGWMLFNEEPRVALGPYERDLKTDPVVAFQDKYYVALAILVGFGLPTLIGYFLGSALGGLAVGGFLRIVAVHHATFFINSWCHYFGRQTYTDTNTAKDSFIMAVATFGEGYHNFHHIFANDYRNGFRWYHWDPTKWTIQIFYLLGGAYDLQKTPRSEIVRMQLEMDEKRLKAQLDSKWQTTFQVQIDNLKVQIHSAQLRFEKLREEYRLTASNYAESSVERLREIKFQARMAKIEFRAALKQWRAYNSFLLTAQTA